MKTALNFVFGLLLFAAGLAMLEFGVRAYGSMFHVYDLEMWRYSKELKQLHPDPRIRYQHRANADLELQGVRVRTNSHGLRGPEPRSPGAREKILFIGSSTLFGWGVPEELTLTSRLESELRKGGRDAEVWNGGIGNYSAVNTVMNFLVSWKPLGATKLVVLLTPSSVRRLPAETPGFFLWHSAILALASTAMQKLAWQQGHASLAEYYRELFSSPVLTNTDNALKELADGAPKGTELFFACLPEANDLGGQEYSLQFAHDELGRIARRHGFTFIDLAPAFLGASAAALASSPFDNHLNAAGHERIATALLPFFLDAQKRK